MVSARLEFVRDQAEVVGIDTQVEEDIDEQCGRDSDHCGRDVATMSENDAEPALEPGCQDLLQRIVHGLGFRIRGPAERLLRGRATVGDLRGGLVAARQ